MSCAVSSWPIHLLCTYIPPTYIYSSMYHHISHPPSPSLHSWTRTYAARLLWTLSGSCVTCMFSPGYGCMYSSCGIWLAYRSSRSSRSLFIYVYSLRLVHLFVISVSGSQSSANRAFGANVMFFLLLSWHTIYAQKTSFLQAKAVATVRYLWIYLARVSGSRDK